jgi:hypothetical protein
VDAVGVALRKREQRVATRSSIVTGHALMSNDGVETTRSTNEMLKVHYRGKIRCFYNIISIDVKIHLFTKVNDWKQQHCQAQQRSLFNCLRGNSLAFVEWLEHRLRINQLMGTIATAVYIRSQ